MRRKRSNLWSDFDSLDIINMSLQLLRAKYPQMPCSQDLKIRSKIGLWVALKTTQLASYCELPTGCQIFQKQRMKKRYANITEKQNNNDVLSSRYCLCPIPIWNINGIVRTQAICLYEVHPILTFENDAEKSQFSSLTYWLQRSYFWDHKVACTSLILACRSCFWS